MSAVADKWLVWKANRGSREAVLEIYEKYKHDLMTLAAALLRDTGGAEDVVHEVFAGFLTYVETFRLTGSLKGYLATCVANAARNLNKAAGGRRNAALEAAEEVQSAVIDPPDAAIHGEQLQRLEAALGRLPYEQREVLLLHVYSGLKFKTIARQQGLSINTVQGRYRYALDKMRSLLNGEVE